MSIFLTKRRLRKNRVVDRRNRQQRFFFGLSIYLVIGAFATIVLSGPSVRSPEAAGTSDVSGVNAIAEIQNLLGPDNQPHPGGSANNMLVRAKLVQRLKQLGLEVAELPFVDKNLSLVNILARRPGLPGVRPVLFVTHYDSTRFGPGASDAMSAVGAMLEAIRSLQSDTLKSEVWFLITDGEELGLRGAANFVRTTPPWGTTKPLVFNFDARGASGTVVMHQTHDENYFLVSKLLAKLAKPTVSNSLMVEVYKRLPNDTDFTVFKNNKDPGMNFALIGSAEVYHTPNDTIANLSVRSVQHFAQHIRSIILTLNDWTQKDWVSLEPSTTAVYFDVLGGPVFSYPAYMNTFFTLITIGLFVAMILRKATMERLRSERLVLLVSAIVAIVVSASIIGWLMSWALRVVEVIDRPFVEGGDILSLAYVFVAVAVTLPIGAMSFAKANTIQVRLAMMGWFTLLSLCTSTMVPGAAFLFHIPAITIGIVSLVAPRERWADIVTAIVSGVLYVPLVLLFIRALGPSHGAVLAGLSALFIAPVMCFMADVAIFQTSLSDEANVEAEAGGEMSLPEA
jgi:Peptidase family M28